MKSRNPQGRPPKPEAERRSTKVEVKLRSDEKQLVERASSITGDSQSDILRKGGLPLAASIVGEQTRKRTRRRSP